MLSEARLHQVKDRKIIMVHCNNKVSYSIENFTDIFTLNGEYQKGLTLRSIDGNKLITMCLSQMENFYPTDSTVGDDRTKWRVKETSYNITKIFDPDGKSEVIDFDKNYFTAHMKRYLYAQRLKPSVCADHGVTGGCTVCANNELMDNNI
mgnify:CR=1 FL=1